MKCEICKYRLNIANTKESGSALCSRNSSYFPVNFYDDCHFIPKKRELVCADCACFGEDFGCFGMEADDKVFSNGRQCSGFIDTRKQDFNQILMFWKVQGLYDRDEINKMIDAFEIFYDDIERQ